MLTFWGSDTQHLDHVSCYVVPRASGEPNRCAMVLPIPKQPESVDVLTRDSCRFGTMGGQEVVRRYL